MSLFTDDPHGVNGVLKYITEDFGFSKVASFERCDNRSIVFVVDFFNRNDKSFLEKFHKDIANQYYNSPAIKRIGASYEKKIQELEAKITQLESDNSNILDHLDNGLEYLGDK